MILQILIESLPISSSGHVALAQRLISYFNGAWLPDSCHETIDFLLHGPALCIMVAYFFSTWWSMIVQTSFSWRQFFTIKTYIKSISAITFVIVADMVTVSLWLSDFAKNIWIQKYFLTFGFGCTALMLWWLQYFSGSKKTEWKLSDAIILGFVQGLALLPGISRFASTVFAGTWLGYNRRDSFALSFLIQLPLVLAAFCKGIVSVMQDNCACSGILFDFYLLFVMVGSTFASYYVLFMVGQILEKNKMKYFAWYMVVPIIISILV